MEEVRGHGTRSDAESGKFIRLKLRIKFFLIVIMGIRTNDKEEEHSWCLYTSNIFHGYIENTVQWESRMTWKLLLLLLLLPHVSLLWLGLAFVIRKSCCWHLTWIGEWRDYYHESFGFQTSGCSLGARLKGNLTDRTLFTKRWLSVLVLFLRHSPSQAFPSISWEKLIL